MSDGSSTSAWDDRALVTVMSLVPNFFSRNRMPDFFAEPRVARARTRARLLRSIARDLRGGHGRDPAELTLSPVPAQVELVKLRYLLPSVFLSRAVELATFEVVLLRRLLAGASPQELGPQDDDALRVEEWLHGLMRVGP